MIFATGGILATYYSGQRLHAGGFFEACGHHFWRFVRLTIYLLIVLIPVFILGGIAYHVYDRIDKQSISPMSAVHFFEAAVVVLFFLICIRVWFDMAQVIAVAEDERRMHKALRRSAALLRHNFFSLYWLYLRVSLIAWIVLRYRASHLDDASSSRIHPRSVPAFSIPYHLLARLPLMAARQRMHMVQGASTCHRGFRPDIRSATCYFSRASRCSDGLVEGSHDDAFQRRGLCRAGAFAQATT